mmetsp:Transcript_61317/g.70277  ORF Transcript_61317/g.70277 Transcript_61317/m.70277 type:complete len:843 (+) Transcript_61317:32-2560(+)
MNGRLNGSIIYVILMLFLTGVSSLSLLNPLRDRIVWVATSGTTKVVIPESMVTSNGSAVFSVSTADFPSWLTYTQSSRTLLITSPIDKNGPFKVEVTVTEDGDIVKDDFSLTIEHRVDWPAEFRINTYTNKDQRFPDFALLKNGSAIIVWQSDGQDGDGEGIYGKIIDPKTQRVLLPEFQINDYTTSHQRYPKVAQIQGGKVIVTWESVGSSLGVFAKMFDPAVGVADNTEFLINTYTSRAQYVPDVTVLNNGNIFLVWVSWNQGGIFATILSPEREIVVPEFHVNTTSSYDQWFPRALSLSDGRILVMWHSWAQDGGDIDGVFARLLNPDGSESLAEFQVNNYAYLAQRYGCATELAGNKIFFVWESSGQVTSSYGIYGRVFDSLTGEELVPEFRLNDYTKGGQRFPDVASLQDGNVLVSWASHDSASGSIGLIYGKVVNPNDGSTVVSEMLFTEYSLWKYRHLLVQLDDGSLFMAYASYPQDGSNYGVYGRVVTLETIPLCDTTSVAHRYGAVSWMTDANPQVEAIRGPNSSRITFSIPDLESCIAKSVSIEVAHRHNSGYQNLPSTTTKADAFQVDLEFNDSNLQNQNICNVSDSTSTVVYNCTIFFQAYFKEDFIVNWSYSLTLALSNNAVTNLAIDTAQKTIVGDTLNLPLSQTLVGGFDGSTRSPDQPFTVGDEAFFSVSPPDSFVAEVDGNVLSVIMNDNENNPVEAFHLTSLIETQNQNGLLILKVPLIIVSTSAEIVVQIEWSLKNRRRLAEESSSTVSNYSVTLSVQSVNQSSGSEGDGSQTNILTFIIGGVSIFLVLISGIFGYKYTRHRKGKADLSTPTAIPSSDRSDRA